MGSGLMDIVGVSLPQLPLLGDADFLFGPKSPEGHDTYLLCEINVSCVSQSKYVSCPSGDTTRICFAKSTSVASRRFQRPHLSASHGHWRTNSTLPARVAGENVAGESRLIGTSRISWLYEPLFL